MKRVLGAGLVFFILLVLGLIFRYEDAYVERFVVRYDRWTSVVEMMGPDGWVAMPQYRSIDHLKSVRAKMWEDDRNDKLVDAVRLNANLRGIYGKP